MSGGVVLPGGGAWVKKYCALCEGSFVGKSASRFCSKDCKSRAGSSGRPAASRQEKLCESCAKPFHTYKKKVIYCSDACESWDKNLPCTDDCYWCGKGFVKKLKTQKYCSYGCQMAKNKIVDHLKRRFAWGFLEEKKCVECGLGFTPQKRASQKFCSFSCQRRVSDRKHRAARREALGESLCELVDPFDIFERDGWHCQICGTRTPKKLRGTFHKNAPELDHIVPVTGGGAHNEPNLQTLCKQCNIHKGNKRGLLPVAIYCITKKHFKNTALEITWSFAVSAANDYLQENGGLLGKL